MRGKAMFAAAVALTLAALGLTARVGRQASLDGPRYTEDGALALPGNYREWPFLGSGLGMTYDPAPGLQSGRPQRFTNVFVNPSSHREFLRTGMWPDRTVLLLEFRRSGSEASINQAGRFQTDFVGLEANVKDSRFPEGWAFFNFGDSDTGERVTGEREAGCIACHTEHTAVERTFVQFYPTMLEAARARGTLKPGFEEDAASEAK